MYSEFILTFTTLLANSADNIVIFFLFFPENRIWQFMQIISTGDNLPELSTPVLWEKVEKYFIKSSAETFTQSAKRGYPFSGGNSTLCFCLPSERGLP